MKRAKVFAFLCALWLACAPTLAAPAGEERLRPAGEVVVVLSEQFLNSVLEEVAAQPEPPSFPLSRGREGKKCADVIRLVPESGGVRTSVKFRDGAVAAPVAFRGTYEAALLGCVSFEGWADTSFHLEFDQSRQALLARLTVREVKLKNVPSMMGGGLTGLVQDAIDARVNPVEILRAEQLGVRLPSPPGRELRLRAREVRHEVAGPELRLRIAYEIVQAR